MRRRIEVLPVTSGLDALFEGRPATLSVQDVADIFNVSKPGVYKWLKDGVIPGYKLGVTWFILRDELKERLEAGTNTRPSGSVVTSGELPIGSDDTPPADAQVSAPENDEGDV
jgi:excisionase family DNA binding protein